MDDSYPAPMQLDIARIQSIVVGVFFSEPSINFPVATPSCLLSSAGEAGGFEALSAVARSRR